MNTIGETPTGIWATETCPCGETLRIPLDDGLWIADSRDRLLEFRHRHARHRDNSRHLDRLQPTAG